MAAKKSKSAKSAKPSRKVAAKSAPKKAKSPAVESTQRKVMPGYVSHTEFVSNDPAATRSWAEKAFAWKFEVMPSPSGDYHMWTHKSTMTGGGIRGRTPAELAAAIPYVEVPAMQASYAKALAAGASEMMPPMEIPGGMGWIAVVQAPGGPAVGLWSNKK